MQGAAHKAKAQQKNQLQQTLLTQPTSSNLSSNFYADLTRAFVAANIPWNAIENPVLRQFLQKYCKQNIPSESTLRKNYLDRIYNETLASIREDIGDSYIWVSVDETSDPMNRYIANMVVGKLSPDGPSIPHLVCVKELSKVNSQAIAYFVNKGLQSLYSGNIDDSKVLLFCTDAASYMVAAAPLLKTFYPNLTHVTCLAHGLHRVSETIRNEFPLVNSFISNTKKCFCKAPSRISIFRENFPDIPLPPQPVVTRWGTWIQSVVYYSKYFKEVVTVIDKLPETDSAACVKAVKDCLNDSRVKNDIAYITSNFSFIPASIEQLEREKQSLCSQIAIVKEAQVNIHSALGETGKKVKNKWDNVLNKNVGFSLLEKVSRVISGESVNVPVSIDVSIVPNLKFAPLTSVSVERSFSAFKMILSDKRQRLTVENLEKILVVYCADNYNKV